MLRSQVRFLLAPPAPVPPLTRLESGVSVFLDRSWNDFGNEPRLALPRQRVDRLMIVRRSAFVVFRRAAFAVAWTAFVAAVLRLRGKGGVPPQTGGWRELDVRSPISK